MKRIRFLLLIFIFIINLSACDNTSEDESNKQKNDSEEVIVDNEISMELPVVSVYAKKDGEQTVVVFTGRVEVGTIKNTDNIHIILEDGTEIEASIYKLEQNHDNPIKASAGDNIGVVVSDVNIEDVRTAVKIVH